MTTWRKMISEEMEANGESWAAVVHTTLTEKEMDDVFDCGYGLTEGLPFTLWTRARVYFPVCYDGSEWVASVPRDPCDEATDHYGG